MAFPARNVARLAIERSAEQVSKVGSEVNDAFNLSLEAVAEGIASLPNGDRTKLDTRLMEELMLGYAEIQCKLEGFQQAYQELQPNLRVCNFEEFGENLAESCQSKTGQLPEEKLKKHRFYKSLQDILVSPETASTQDQAESAADNTRDNDGIFVTQDATVPIDPITKKEITDPVRNKICKHNYERESIMHYISSHRGRGVRCPVGACANHANMDMSSLEDDDELRRLIIRRRIASQYSTQ